MTQIVPVTNYPDQTMRIVLDGTPYTLRVYWSDYDADLQALIGDDIDGQWYADLTDDTGTVAIYGMAVVTGCDMLFPYAFDQLGGLWVADDEGKGRDLSRAALGDTHQLIYVPVAEKDDFDRAIGWRR